ncbi:restriction endonuclease subunit S [Yersinia thracica]|uniref:restriction endonuclease subunit S n=1 Tax=Yersinia thracica TaxID=2890319 RepID=UPI0011A16457|nr:restriction endonuclease subunit S [Yersinia thracica]
MSVNNKVPEIRFKGFSGEWENLTLGDLGSVAMNKRIFKHQTTITGDVPFFKIGTFGKQPDAFINKALFDEYKAKYPYPVAGDLLLSASGSIGRVVEYKGEDQYFQDSNIVWLKHDGKIDNAFLKVFYSMVKWSGLEGSTIKRLYNKNILDTEISTPERQEQNVIGNYFQKLDSLINQHQQKHDKLSNIKKAMLEKMFPKPGETVPEIRFKGFSGEWVENNLGELIDIRSAARVHKEQWTEAGVPFFRTSDVVSIYKGQENTKAYISHEIYHGLSEKIGKVTKDDLLITGGGSIGIPYLVPNDSPLYFKDADLLWLKNNEKFNGYFLYTFFFSVSFKQHIKSISHTGTIAHYTIEQAKATPINTCSDEEQTAIGNYFQKLDALINQHQQQIAKLNNIKQACLSKMFI